MKFQYLGTSASEGVPAVFCECEMCNEVRRRGGRDLRTRSCAVINDKVMLDFGPEAYVQSVRFGVHLSKIRHLLVTHPHTDHFQMNNFPLRGGFWGMNLCEDVMTVYGGKEVFERVSEYLETGREVTRPHFAAKKLTAFEPFEDDEYKFIPLRAQHDPSIECLFYLVEDKKENKRVLYIHDTENDIDDSLDFIKGIHCDMVSFDCTMARGFVKKGERHMGIQNDLLVRDKLIENGVVDSSTRLVCSHICHHKGFYDDLARDFAKEGFELAYDGMIIEL